MAKVLPIRVVLTRQGARRRFFSIVVGRDNSFYFHLSRPSGQPWRVPGHDQRRPGAEPLDFVKFIQPDFELQKVSFHPSGFIGQTDNSRPSRRYRDGLRGQPFSDALLPYPLCLIVPCEVDQLPEFKPKPGNLLEIVLEDAVRPFYAEVILVRTEAPGLTSGPPTLGPPIHIALPEFAFSLTIALRAVLDSERSELPPWPPFPFFVLSTPLTVVKLTS